MARAFDVDFGEHGHGMRCHTPRRQRELAVEKTPDGIIEMCCPFHNFDCTLIIVGPNRYILAVAPVRVVAIHPLDL